MKYNLWFAFFLFLGGCSPSSLEDFRQEGEAFSRTLMQDLRNIHNREDLLRAEPFLKKRFEALVDLIIGAREHQRHHPEEEIGESNAFNDELLLEFKRIYALEGGQEIVERAQRESLIRLDAYEKKLSKQNQLVPK